MDMFQGRSYVYASGSADTDDFAVTSYSQRFFTTLDPGRKYVRPQQIGSPAVRPIFRFLGPGT